VLVESCIRSALDIPPSQQILCLGSKGAPVDVLAAPSNSTIRIVDICVNSAKSETVSERTPTSTDPLVRKTVTFDLTGGSGDETNLQRDGQMSAIIPPIRDGGDSISESDHLRLSETSSHDVDSQPDRRTRTLHGRLRTFSKALMRVRLVCHCRVAFDIRRPLTSLCVCGSRLSRSHRSKTSTSRKIGCTPILEETLSRDNCCDWNALMLTCPMSERGSRFCGGPSR
jgi:hypothetical protein